MQGFLLPIPITWSGATSVSMASNALSDPIPVQYMDNIGIQMIWTGTPTGTFDVQVSNTATTGTTGKISGGTFTPLGLTGGTASGSAGNGFFNLEGLAGAYLKLNYTASGGTGTLTAALVAKGL